MTSTTAVGPFRWRDERGLLRGAGHLALAGAIAATALTLAGAAATPWWPWAPALGAAAAFVGSGALTSRAAFSRARHRVLAAAGFALGALAAFPSWTAAGAALAAGAAPGLAPLGLGAAAGLCLCAGLLPRHVRLRPWRLVWRARAALPADLAALAAAAIACAIGRTKRIRRCPPP